ASPGHPHRLPSHRVKEQDLISRPYVTQGVRIGALRGHCASMLRQAAPGVCTGQALCGGARVGDTASTGHIAFRSLWPSESSGAIVYVRVFRDLTESRALLSLCCSHLEKTLLCETASEEPFPCAGESLSAPLWVSQISLGLQDTPRTCHTTRSWLAYPIARFLSGSRRAVKGAVALTTLFLPPPPRPWAHAP